jgi:NADH-quinone oxidoreductase subunit E
MRTNKRRPGDGDPGPTSGPPDSTAELLSGYPASRDELIPILQAIQGREGYISRDSIYAVGHHLGLPEAKIFGVATFYNQFRLDPPGRYRVAICRGTACHVKGSFDLLEALQRELGVKAGETTRDGLFSLETVACLGACALAPVMSVNGEFYGRLDRARVQAILAGIRQREARSG